MSAATPTGAELRARREALGWSFDDVACRPEMYGDYDELDIACMENCGAASLVVKWPDGSRAYAAALAAEEQRRGSAPITAEQVARAFSEENHIDYRVLGSDWEAKAPAYVIAASDGSDWDEKLATLQRWHRELLAAERAAAPLTEPVAPEGVTVRTVTDLKCTYVSINRGCRDDLIATVWHSDARAVSIEDEYATPEALRFVADLADYRAAQHAAGDRQRKLDAVKAAEDAYEKASADYSHAQFLYDEMARALNAARKEAGFT